MEFAPAGCSGHGLAGMARWSQRKNGNAIESKKIIVVYFFYVKGIIYYFDLYFLLICVFFIVIFYYFVNYITLL